MDFLSSQPSEEESPSLSPSPSPVLGEDGPYRGLKAPTAVPEVCCRLPVVY